MKTTDVQEYAQSLYQVHGDKAELEAAQKARSLEEAGKLEDAADWRKIRDALKLLKGPHAS